MRGWFFEKLLQGIQEIKNIDRLEVETKTKDHRALESFKHSVSHTFTMGHFEYEKRRAKRRLRVVLFHLPCPSAIKLTNKEHFSNIPPT